MLKKLGACHALTCVLALAAGWSTPGAAAALPDATLFTTYTVATDLRSANWVVCGSTQEDEGCYDSGNIGPFERIGAMMQGTPSYNGDTVTRRIFVLDVATGTTGKGVTLFVYTKTDVISSSFDTTTIMLTRTISLPLVGGSSVKAYMAANTGYLYAGTDQSLQAATIQKGTWVVNAVGGFSAPIPVTSITSDSQGYVTVTFGSSSGQSGFYVFGPKGGVEDGGGSSFMLDTSNGVIPPP